MDKDTCYPHDGLELFVCCGENDFEKVNVCQEIFDGKLSDVEYDAACQHCGKIVSSFSYGAWGV